jgi:hypothetical protein
MSWYVVKMRRVGGEVVDVDGDGALRSVIGWPASANGRKGRGRIRKNEA